jgi:hypothetical protein
MFETKKTSLEQITDPLEIEAISTFLQDNPWDESFEPEDIPPKWLLDWSESWDVEWLWGVELGEVYGNGYLIHDRSTDETFFTDLHPDGCCGFEKFDTPTKSLSVKDVCDQTFKYWRDVMTDTLVFGDVTINEPKWLPRNEVKAFMQKLMDDNDMDTTGDLSLDEWLDREYGDAK